MPDMSMISGMVASLNLAKDIAKAMISVRDGQAFQAKLIEFQSALIDAHSKAIAAQGEHAALVERIAELEAEMAALKDWEAEKQRYELSEPHPGLFAYTVKLAMKGAEPFHRLCANCYQNSAKSILQTRREPDFDLVEWTCGHCKQALRLPADDA